MSRIGRNLPHRSSTLPTPSVSHPRPPARASTLPPTAASSVAPRPAVLPTAVPGAAVATQSRPVKHPGALADAPSYSPWEKSTGNASNLRVGGGDSKLTPPPNATQTMLIDRPGNPHERDAFGGTLKTNLGSLQASTTHHNSGGLYHYSAQAEVNGPQASYELQKVHAGRLGITSAQLTAEANTFKAQGQAGISADTKGHAYTAALTGKAETGVGVTASASHDFNRHVGGYVKGEAKASAGAYAEGVASLDPKTATALLSGQVGASATAGVYGTAGGHVGRLHGSFTAGAVAGVAAQAGGKVGLENGFLTHSADVNAAMGVGTHLKADAAVDLRHHLTPGVASGLRASLASSSGVAAPAGAVEPEKSRLEKFFAQMTGG